MKKNIGLLSLIALLITGIMLWEDVDLSDVVRLSGGKTPRPLVLIQPTLLEFGKEDLKIKIHAARAEIYTQTKKAHLSQIEGQIFSKNRVGNAATFVADQGIADSKAEKITLNGNVEVDFGDGRRLETEQLFVDQRTQQLYNHSALRFFEKEDIILAESFSYQFQSERLILNKAKISLELQ